MYYAKRLGTLGATLLGTSLLLFIVLRVLPGDPTITVLGGARNTDPAAIEALRRELGLEGSIAQQYMDWLAGFVRGDLGESYFNRESVSSIVGGRIVPTLVLTISAMALAILAAVPVATIAASRPGGLTDRVSAFLTSAALASPMFLTAVIFVTLFSVQLGWFPSRGYASPWAEPVEFLRFLALPAVTLALAAWAPVTRFLRSSLQEVRSATYVRTAQGKGLGKWQVLMKHSLPNAALPTLTVIGLNIGSLLGGSVIIEYVFSWPGLGSLIVDSVAKRDYAVLQSAVLLVAFLFLLTMAVIEIAYGLLDPRLRHRKERA